MCHCAGCAVGPWYTGGTGNASAHGSTGPLPGLEDFEKDVMLSAKRWVEEDEAPERIAATKLGKDTAEGGVVGQRPLCVFARRRGMSGATRTRQGVGRVGQC